MSADSANYTGRCRKREPGQVRTVNDRVEDFIHKTAWAQHALLFIVIAGTCTPSGLGRRARV